MVSRFKENAQLAYGIGQIMDKLKTLQRGDVLSHEMIASLSGIVVDSVQYNTLRQKIRRQALKILGYTIVAVPGVGYRIATPADQANDAMGRGERAGRQFHRGAKEINAAPDDQLSEHQRRIKNAKVGVFKAGRSHALKAGRIEKVLAKVQETRPKAMR